MPALTHGRVKNGFNQYSRIINMKTAKDPKTGRSYMCCATGGKAILPTKYNNYSNGCFKGNCRVPTGTISNIDRSIASGGIGSRSFATKRAIARRVQNRNQLPKGSAKIKNNKAGIIILLFVLCVP